MKTLRIDYDKDYGVQSRNGWSVSIDGHYYVQFRKSLTLALIVSFWKHHRERLY